MTTIARLRLAALAAVAIATCAPAFAATPSPAPTRHPLAIPTPHLPPEKLHADYVVEVNKKGQVVAIVSGHGTKYATFNSQTYGNAAQMWIRKADGSAVVGTFRVTYDYDPKTRMVSRHIALVSLGGNWGDKEGAANAMIDTAKKEAAAYAAWKAQQDKSGASLPSLNQITGKKTPAPVATLKPEPLPT
jgi:hypothetical protein